MDKISDNLQYNIDGIKGFFKDRQDLICKDILCGQDRLCVMYVVGLIDVLQTGDFLISPLLEIGQLPVTNKLDYLKKEVLIFPEISSVQDHKTVVDNLLHGKVVLFIDGENSALSFALDKMKERAIDEPPTNAVLKGPRGGFVENYKTNLVLIKKILATENLKMKSLEVGEFTKTTISIVYIDGVCDKNIVDGVVRKIEKIILW